MPDLSHPCPTCGVNIQFPEAQTGDAAQCPICSAAVNLIPQTPVHDDFAKLELAVIKPVPKPAQPLEVTPVIQPAPPVASPVAPPVIEQHVHFHGQFGGGRSANKEKVSATTAGGCVAFLAGICLLPFVPIGTLVGIGFIIAAIMTSHKHQCGACKMEVDPHARVCPHCTLDLISEQTR